MSNSSGDRIIRSRSSGALAGFPFAFLAMILFGCLSAGCGGSGDETAVDSGGDGANAASSDSSTEGSGTTASDAATTDSSQMAPAGGSATKSGVDPNGGLQLPDAGVPGDGAGGDESGGPATPGSGGIEMPDVTPSSDATSGGPAAASDLDLQFASWKEIESRATSTGTVTVVDLWSTVCEPCVKEFPGLVRLSESMNDRVTCIGVSVDYDGRKTRPPETYSERVSGFLHAVGAEFDNYVCNTPSDDVFSMVGLPSIPAVLIYDAEGQLVKQFVDSGETIGFSYDKDVIPFVKKIAG